MIERPLKYQLFDILTKCAKPSKLFSFRPRTKREHSKNLSNLPDSSFPKFEEVILKLKLVKLSYFVFSFLVYVFRFLV